MLRQSPFGKKQKYFKSVFFSNFPHAAFILYTVHMSIAYLVCIFIEGLVNTVCSQNDGFTPVSHSFQNDMSPNEPTYSREFDREVYTLFIK